MPYRATLILILLLSFQDVRATIFCPPDKTISCYDDIHALSLTGTPTVLNYPPELARYTDQGPNGICNAGIINRTWYIDLNQNNQLDSGEDACVQKITVQYTGAPVIISFPPDRQYACVEEIVTEAPEWTSGACDMIGVSRQDQVFTAAADACYKILRKYTVINWCTYLPGTPGWNGEGIWTHTQLIKVVEQSRPVIKNCAPVIISTDAGCEGTFTIRNSADDPGACGRQALLWTAEVDLWSDGSTDYTYGFNQPGQFRLDSVANKKEIVITLPGKVRMGTHKVTWKVRDLCGNNTSCVQSVQMKDTKRPTPYMHDLLSASFDARAMDLMVPARLFNIGSTDNCTPSVFLKYSFSKDIHDTIRVIDCATAGFQFFTIYVTDLMGNQEYAEVFMLAFDNGSCNQTLSLTGSVRESNGTAMPDQTFQLTDPAHAEIRTTVSDAEGGFRFQNIGLYKDMVVAPAAESTVPETVWAERVNIRDLKLLQDHITGVRRLENFEWLAADVDGDGKIRVRDVSELKHRILHPAATGRIRKYYADTDTIRGEADLQSVRSAIQLGASDGKIDFTSVVTGDISDANRVSAITRNTTRADIVTKEDWIHVHIGEAETIDGLQLAVHLPDGFIPVEVKSAILGMQNVPYCFDETTSTLRWLALGRMFADEKTPLLSIRGDQTAKENATLLTAESGLLLPGYAYQKLVLRQNHNQQTMPLTASPNPCDGHFTLSDPAAMVSSATDAMGREVRWVQSGPQVTLEGARGLVYVRITTGDQVQTRVVMVAR